MAKKRIDTSGAANPISSNPFAALDATSFGDAKTNPSTVSPERVSSKRSKPNTKRGRVDVTRQTAGRGGKTVTVLKGFKGISERELQELARKIQRACGVGGTVKSGTIEIQGDQRDRAIVALADSGFQGVRAGG